MHKKRDALNIRTETIHSTQHVALPPLMLTSVRHTVYVRIIIAIMIIYTWTQAKKKQKNTSTPDTD